MTEAEVLKALGHELWTASRRFGVEQPRPGNHRKSGRLMISASHSSMRVGVGGVDAIASFVKPWAEKILEGRSDAAGGFPMKLEHGTRLAGTLHPDFDGAGGCWRDSVPIWGRHTDSALWQSTGGM